MTTDLVARLRDWAACWTELRICGEAADEIERLRKENAERQEAIEQAEVELDRLRIEADAGHKEISRLNTHINKLDAEIERLRANRPYSEIDIDMHVDAVTKDLKAEVGRLCNENGRLRYENERLRAEVIEWKNQARYLQASVALITRKVESNDY